VPIFQRFLILTVLDKTGHVKIPEINVTYILPICLLPTDFVNVTFFLATLFVKVYSAEILNYYYYYYLLSGNMYAIYHCCVYSEKHLMMDRGIVRNM
jgi:hypothetical protein